MLEVKDHETVCILVSARDTDTVAATARGDIGGVGADGHDAVVDADQVCVLRVGFVEIVDVAVGWVVLLIGYQPIGFTV